MVANRALNWVFFALAPSLVVWACSSGDSSGAKNNPNDAGTLAEATASDAAMSDTGGSDAARRADGSGPTDAAFPMDASDAGCPTATAVCNGYCLSPGGSAGNCTALVTSAGMQVDNGILAVAAQHVYYGAQSGSGLNNDFIWRIPAAGGASEKVSSGQNVISTIAVDANNLYFLTWLGQNSQSSSFNSGSVGQMPLSGGMTTILTPNGGKDPAALAVDGTYVYWVGPSQGASYVPATVGPAIHRVPIGGGQATDIGIALKPTDVVVDDANVYWTDNGSIWSTPTATAGSTPLGDGGPDAGGAAQLIATTDSHLFLALDGNYVYFTSTVGGLYRIPKSGAASAEQLVMTNGAGPMAIDANDIYFTSHDGHVMRWHKADGSTSAIAEIAPFASGPIALDDMNAYLMVTPIQSGDGGFAILKVAK